jgi:outer membrane protein TolC
MKASSIPARALALLLACMPALEARGAGALGFNEALRLAQQRSGQLAAQDAAATAAREMAVAAAQLPDPTLKAGINNLPVNGPDRFSLGRDFMTMRSLGVAQEFTREDKRHARATRFEREADAAQAERMLALAELQAGTASAWLERHYQERIHALLATQQREARLQIEAADAAWRGGRGSPADAFAARAGLAQIDDRLAQGERQIATATTQLARWIGDDAAQPLGALPATDAAPLNMAELESHLAHHPRIAVLERQEGIAQAEADIARANRRPDWSAELMFSQRGAAYSNMVSFNVSVPLQWNAGNRQERELAAKLATVEQLRARREDATRAHLAEVRAMLQEWQANRQRIERYARELIPLAGERTRAALSAYRAGTGTLAPVLDARRSEIDAGIERLRRESEAARAWAQLRFLVPVGQGEAK